jgi:hypothetical protein
VCMVTVTFSEAILVKVRESRMEGRWMQKMKVKFERRERSQPEELGRQVPAKRKLAAFVPFGSKHLQR